MFRPTFHPLNAASDPSCYGLLKKLMKVKKIGTIYILREVLPELSDLSRVFQQGTINFPPSNHQSPFARRNLPHLLRANLQVFDKTAIPLKESDDDMDYGKEHIDVLASHYFPGDEVSQTQLQAEWKLIKYDLLTWKLPQAVRDGKLSCTEWVMQQLFKQRFAHRGHFPLMISVVKTLLVIAVSNTLPERGQPK